MISSARCAAAVFALSLLVLAGAAGAQDGFTLRATDAPHAEPASVTGGGDLAPRATDFPADSFMVPLFRVDRGNPFGETTLIAVRNVTDQGHDVNISYWVDHAFDPFGDPDLIQSFSLSPGQTVPINLRDLPEITGGQGGDDLVRGWLIVEHGDGVGDALSADWFQVNPDQNFATGGRMVDTDHSYTCTQWDFRYITGGAFDGGTRLGVFIDTPLGFGTPSFTVDFISEAGAFQGAVIVSTNRQVLELDVESDLLALLAGSPPDSGGMVITFAGGTNGGLVTGTYSAEDRYSIGLNGACIVP
jgi:hypothetical protein